MKMAPFFASNAEISTSRWDELSVFKAAGTYTHPTNQYRLGIIVR